jgi:3-hydroxyisobutyrate dehydrogenase-like beta-hydroxyacid dehydrogenase
MVDYVATIGFGEAAQVSARAGWRTFDPLPACMAAAARHGVTVFYTNAAAVDGASTVLRLVTADQAIKAATTTASPIGAHTLFVDMNSVAPEAQWLAARAIEDRVARYVDMAIMAPVHPVGRSVPLLVSGPHAAAGADALNRTGFTDVRIVGGDVGQASAIKMIRSVMVKRIEALTAKTVLAADAAGVRSEVLASLGTGWDARAAYNTERMTTHGRRRAAKMVEVAKTLVALGVAPVLTCATVQRPRAAGEAGMLKDVTA